ncbi:MAG TPA: DUF2851 family protein [Cyclobacteriaceae bacterium]|nr:DUF2851 family protein [Cyclobacteriaceae bacterium]
MTESFLHYLWQFQYFDKKGLVTTTGEPITILNQGILNTDAGPDFSQVKIKIGAIDWAGSVEIHIQSSGWYEHKHHEDAAYENVVLHVVWEENKPVQRKDGTRLPTLELKDRADKILQKSYQKLVTNTAVIPCQSVFENVNAVTRHSMIDKAAMIRLEEKSKQVLKLLEANQGDWEETVYQLLALGFGFKVNKDPFLQLAKALPYKLIRKHRAKVEQVEALLFGQAGFLMAKTKDEYLAQLYNEFEFLTKKYNLTQNQLHPSQWKFLRLRPANFPSLRIAQFAALLSIKENIFSTLLEIENYRDLESLFRVQTSPYWKQHYRFSKPVSGAVPELGTDSREVLLINTVIPILIAYGQSRDDWSYVDRAVQFLQQIPAEKNKITRTWQQLNCVATNAFETQGLIELYNNFCQRRACLNCTIGSAILKPVV